VSASEPIDRERRANFTYLQGCADDEEEWANVGSGKKLTAELFWSHKTRILESNRDRCVGAVEEIIANELVAESGGGGGVCACTREQNSGSASPYNWIKVPNFSAAALAVGGRRAGRPPECWGHFDAVLNVTMEEYEEMRKPMQALSSTAGASPLAAEGSSPPSPEEGLPRYLQCPVAEGKRDRHGLEKVV